MNTNAFDTVDLLDGNIFQVTWDVGRRCNYDCSYCPVHRHDNHSPHASLDDLKKNAEFVLKYIDLYMTYRDYKWSAINFTGGEPTVNPNFIPFMQHLRSRYEESYKDKWNCAFTLTSNGAMSKKMADSVLENFDHTTISYHAEADDLLKDQAKARIVQFSEEGPAHNMNVSINVMFHAEYFDECKAVCSFLDEKGVAYVPRIIGEEPDSRPSFAHKYSDEQLQWMKDYWTNSNKKVNNG